MLQSNKFAHESAIPIFLDMQQFVEFVKFSSNENSNVEVVKCYVF